MIPVDKSLRKAARRALLPVATVSAANLISLSTAIWQAVKLPGDWGPYAVLYLIIISAVWHHRIAQITTAIRRGDPLSRDPADQRRRRIRGRIIALPLAYLVFLALGADLLVAGILAGLLWVPPLLLTRTEGHLLHLHSLTLISRNGTTP